MERLTHERVNGIKTGYWSAATKKNIADYFLKNMGDLIDAGKVVVMQ